MPTLTEMLVLLAWIPVHHQIHEGLHHVTVPKKEAEVISYRPYPHKLRNQIFVFGSHTVRCKVDAERCDEALSLSDLAPHLFNTTLYASSNVAYRVFDDKKKKRLTVLLGMVAPLWDTSLQLLISKKRMGDFRQLDTPHKMVFGGFLLSAWINTIYKWVENN